MENLVCLRCGKFFYHSGSFKRHLKKKKECFPNLSNKTLEEVSIFYGYSLGKKLDKINEMDVIEKEKKKKINLENKSFLKTNEEYNIMKVESKTNKNKKYQCPYCFQYYTRKNNMVSHIKNYCKMTPENGVINKGDIERLRQSIEEIKNKPSVVNYNNLQINNIQLHKFGDEKPIEIPNEILHKIIKNPLKGIPDLIGMHHFNPDYPENQNVRYSGNKKFYVDVFNGNFWEAKDKGEVIHNMIVSKKDIADDYFDESVEKNEIHEKTIEKYNDFSEKVDRYVNAILNELNYEGDLLKEDKDVYHQLYKQVELMMINAQRILHLKSNKSPSIFSV